MASFTTISEALAAYGQWLPSPRDAQRVPVTHSFAGDFRVMQEMVLAQACGSLKSLTTYTHIGYI